MTEPTTPAGSPMTTSRDPIEAPRNLAAERHLLILQEWCDDGLITPGTLIAAHDGFNEALAAARNEGRREAVREIREHVADADTIEPLDGPATIRINDLATILDGVNRHGRFHQSERSMTTNTDPRPATLTPEQYVSLRDAISAHIERAARETGTYHGDPAATPGGTGYCLPAAVATQIVDKYLLGARRESEPTR